MKSFKETLGYDLLCTDKCECPYCHSKNYIQETKLVDETGFPFMKCDDCKKLWISD